jgi:hypothetical protein
VTLGRNGDGSRLLRFQYRIDEARTGRICAAGRRTRFRSYYCRKHVDLLPARVDEAINTGSQRRAGNDRMTAKRGRCERLATALKRILYPPGATKETQGGETANSIFELNN